MAAPDKPIIRPVLYDQSTARERIGPTVSAINNLAAFSGASNDFRDASAETIPTEFSVAGDSIQPGGLVWVDAAGTGIQGIGEVPAFYDGCYHVIHTDNEILLDYPPFPLNNRIFVQLVASYSASDLPMIRFQYFNQFGVAKGEASIGLVRSGNTIYVRQRQPFTDPTFTRFGRGPLKSRVLGSGTSGLVVLSFFIEKPNILRGSTGLSSSARYDNLAAANADARAGGAFAALAGTAFNIGAHNFKRLLTQGRYSSTAGRDTGYIIPTLSGDSLHYFRITTGDALNDVFTRPPPPLPPTEAATSLTDLGEIE